MINQAIEIEAIVEDLIENTILELFQSNFSTKSEFGYAIGVLKDKIEELEASDHDSIFDK